MNSDLKILSYRGVSKMSQCSFVLLRGPNKQTQCRNDAQKNSTLCSRHKIKSENPFREFQLLKLPMDVLIEIATFLNCVNGVAFTKINKEIYNAAHLSGRNSRIWSLWFSNLRENGEIISDEMDTKIQQQTVKIYAQKECQKCRISVGKFYPELLVRLCYECFLNVSLSRSKLKTYYRIPDDILDGIKSVQLNFRRGVGKFFIIRHVEHFLGMSLYDYRQSAMRLAEESSKQARKRRSELLAHSKSVRLEITKKALDRLKLISNSQSMTSISLTRLKQFSSIKSLNIRNITNADDFDEKRMDVLLGNISNEHDDILHKKALIDNYIISDIPSFSEFPLRKQLGYLNIMEQKGNDFLSDWNRVKKLGKWRPSEIADIDEKLELKNAEIANVANTIRERIDILKRIKKELKKRNKINFDKFVDDLRERCRKEELAICPSLNTDSGRREKLIEILKKHKMELRPDSSLCKSYIFGCKNPLGEVIAIMKMTSFLFSYSYIHFSTFHVDMRQKLLQEMYEFRNTKYYNDWVYACSNTISKMSHKISNFVPYNHYDDYRDYEYDNY